MESIKKLYVYGPGPSSSHTIGPYNATIDFLSSFEKKKINISSIKVTLFGSLALTGKGHLTDKIILSTINNKYNSNIIFDKKTTNLKHPNTMLFEAFDKDNNLLLSAIYFSVGGGKIVKNKLTNKSDKQKETYPFNNLEEIKNYFKNNNILDIPQFVDKFDDKDINNYISNIVDKMIESVNIGLNTKGFLPGKLKLHRVSGELFDSIKDINNEDNKSLLLTSFAYAAAENNAGGGYVVTAPTCGSCGVIASIIYYLSNYQNISKDKLINGLKVASIFGNIAKQNASISGAYAGCQAEIGVASSMGAALFSYIYDLSFYQIEYAAEVALEHFLGLTCDPVDGYVQIPCIERNGIGVLRSYNAFLYAKNIAPLRRSRVSYDKVIKTMLETGRDLNQNYKETSKGGLAKNIKTK